MSFLGEHLTQMIICASQNKIKVADWKKKREKEEKKKDKLRMIACRINGP